MGFAKSISLSFISIILIISLILIILSLSLSSLLSPTVYIKSLEKAQAFSYLDTQLENVPSAIFIKMPEGGTKILIESLLTNFLSYADSKSDTLNLTVEIDQQKLRSFFLQQIGNIAICSSNQHQDFDNLNKICILPNQTKENLLDTLLKEKNLSFFEKDTVDLAGIYGLEEGSEGRKNLDKLKSYIKVYHYLLIALTIFAIILISLILIINHNTKKSLRWISIPLLISGAIVLTGAIIALDSINDYINQVQYPILPELSRAFVEIISKQAYIYASIIIMSAVLLFVISFIIKSKNK